MKIIKFAAIVLLLAGCFACEEKFGEPKEVSFTEYSLYGTDCQWTNLNYDAMVIIINSENELKRNISCTEGNYPEIDFSKYTLLLASGGGGDVRVVDVNFFETSNNEYTLKVTAHLGIAAVVTGWHIAILTPKISNNAKVILEVENTYD